MTDANVRSEAQVWTWIRKRLVDVEDPTIHTVLIVLVTGAAAGLLLAHDSADRDAVLKAAGGILVVLGSYFAARTLKQTRADQRATRMLKATEMIASESRPVRLGAMWALVDLADSSADKRERGLVIAIRCVLRSVPKDRADDDELQREISRLNQ